MLVNRRINELSRFMTKDNTRPQLQRVCVSKEEAAATDGHVLAIMPIDAGLSDEDYPTGAEISTEITEPILLTAEQVKTAVSVLPKRPTVSVLNNIQIGTKAGAPVINAGAPVMQIPGSKSDGMSYPDYRQVIPDYDSTTAVKVAFDGNLLKSICDLATKHGDYPNQITFQVPTSNAGVSTAVKWEVKNDDDSVVFHGIIMPLRIKD